MDEVDFTILAATAVFSDLVEKCPPAEACRDAIERTAKATIKMAVSTGGFGQVLPAKQYGSKSSVNSRDRANQSDTASTTQSQSQRPPPPPQRPSQQYDLPGITDAYVNASSGAQLAPLQSAAPPGPYRMGSLPNMKADPDGFSMMRSAPGQPRSNASAPEAGSPTESSAIDPSLLPSPGAVRTPPAGGRRGLVGGSPRTNIPGSRGSLVGGLANTGGQGGPQSVSNNMAALFRPSQAPSQPGMIAAAGGPFSPDGGGPPPPLNFADLQGMEFLQHVGGNGGLGGGGGGGLGEGTMDLNLGLGWEGLHHDFSDGQQYDLFDGFFFGGQQGGNGHHNNGGNGDGGASGGAGGGGMGSNGVL